jgi:hypothetical protein
MPMGSLDSKGQVALPRQNSDQQAQVTLYTVQ